MSERFQNQEFVIECLKEHASQGGEGISAADIGKWMIDRYPAECKKKADDSKYIYKKKFFNPDGSLNEDSYKWTLAAEITASYAPRHYKREKPPQWFRKGIRFHDTRPRLFYLAQDIGTLGYRNEWNNLKDSSDVNYVSYITDSAIDANVPVDDAPAPVDSVGLEEDLYPKLGEFLYAEYGILSRRIDEKKSKRGSKGYNKWLFPDVVGLETLGEDFHDGIRELSDKKFKLLSFEVKKDLDRGEVRDAYFQAVSNSSWANFGYLVVTELKPGAKEELEILANRYGIGVIELNHKIPAESNIIIPARENDNIDWGIANRITKINKDFKKYIESIAYYNNNYAQENNGINKEDWDLTPWDLGEEDEDRVELSIIVRQPSPPR